MVSEKLLTTVLLLDLSSVSFCLSFFLAFLHLLTLLTSSTACRVFEMMNEILVDLILPAR